jgi:hypothetical protein
MKEFIYNISGNLGEEFAKQYFQSLKIPFIKASKQEDLRYGIDAYVTNKKTPIDIKNTEFIYIGQILDDGSINIRHPFKKESKATHYCFVNVNKDKQKFIELISIKEKLLRDFFKNEYSLNEFYKFIKEQDNKSYLNFGMNLNQACFKIKNIITLWLNQNVHLIYDEPKQNIINFKLMPKQEIKKINKKDISNARDLIKLNLKKIQIKSTEEEKQKQSLQEDVIIIQL